ncbi:hypothetical protein D3C72_1599950 [compost metagenome]
MREHQHHAGVRQHHGHPLPALDRPLEPECRQQHNQRRRQKQDQPLQAGGDVSQPQEVQEARQVIAQQPQDAHLQAFLGRQGNDLAACRKARLMPRHRREERHGEQHAKGDQGDCVDTIAVGELDDDGLGGKEDRAKHRHGYPGGAAGRPQDRRKLGNTIHAMILSSAQK